MATSKRSEFLDISKGIAIFLMLWGHCIQYCVAESDVDYFENTVFKIIYSFHMPMLMLISGYLFFHSFSKRTLRELLVHRVQSLVQPIVFCSFFHYLVTTVLFHAMSGDLTPAFDGSWITRLPALWFLWSVLAASIAVSVACKKRADLPTQILLLVALAPIAAIFPNAALNLFMYPYFILGFFYGQWKDRLPGIIHKLKYCTLPLFPVLVCFYQKKHYIYITGLLPSEEYSAAEMLAIDGYRWLIGLVGAVFALTVIEMICKWFSGRVSKSILLRGASRLGKKSLQIYALSVPFLSSYLSTLFPKALSVLNMENIFVKSPFVYNFIFTLPMAALYAAGLYFVVKLFEKIKISKLMFGK